MSKDKLTRQARRRLASKKTSVENHRDGKGVSFIVTPEEHETKTLQAAPQIADYFRTKYPNSFTHEMSVFLSYCILPPPDEETREKLQKTMEDLAAIVGSSFGIKKIS